MLRETTSVYVCCVCLLLQDLVQNCLRGERGGGDIECEHHPAIY